MFAVFLAKQGLKYQSIKGYLSALRHLQIAEGLGDPFLPGAFPRLEYVLKGVKHTPSAQARPPRLPITPPILRRLWGLWSKQAHNPDIVMLWAACCLGFFGFMRSGEFTTASIHEFDPQAMLTPADVSVDSHQSPQILCVRLKQSKTDPFRAGVSIYMGRTNQQLCPVAAVLAYLAIRPPTPGPLFIFRDGSYLSRDRLVTRLRQGLQAVNIDPAHFSGHSFRIGAATTAAQAGIEDSVVKMLGRWESAAYQRYIRTPRDQLAAISNQLVHV